MNARTQRKQDKKKRQQRDAALWHYFPLYGLTIVEDDGISTPIFGDATLVSPDSVVEEIRRVGQEPHPLLTHQPVKSFIENGWSGPPIAHLVEMRPHAYVAVRRDNDAAAAELRSQNIRAMLTASIFLRALRTTAFAAEPSQVSWYAVPSSIRVRQGTSTQSDLKVMFNEHVIHRPLVVVKEDLRKSWISGAGIPNQDNLRWDIHSAHPLLHLLAAPDKIEGSQAQKLVRVARHLARACCATPYAAQLQMGVTALEQLLCTSKFADLRERALTFLPQEEELERILDARHRVTHDGWEIPEVEAVALARGVLLRAWTLIDMFAGMLKTLTSTEKHERFVDARAKAAALDRVFEGLTSAAPGHFKKLLEDATRDIGCAMTLRNPGSERTAQ